MGNTSSSISRRHEDGNEAGRSHRSLQESNSQGSAQVSATDHCDVVSSDYSTSPQRKRSRFSSLRNPFRSKESRDARTTSSSNDEAVTSQGRRSNRGSTLARRRRPRTIVDTDRQSAALSFNGDAHISAQHDITAPATIPVAVASECGNTSQSDISRDLAPPIRSGYGLADTRDEILGQVVVPSNSEHTTPVQNVLSSVDDVVDNEVRTISAVTSVANSASASRTTLSNDETANSVVPQRRRYNAGSTGDLRIAQRRRPGDNASASRPVSRRSNSSTDGQSRSGDVVSPMPGEDQAGMLSRLLSVAAAATAASLVGHDNRQALRDAREVVSGSSNAADAAQEQEPASEANTDARVTTENQDDSSSTVDGSFDGFLAALQSGRLAQALRNGGNVMGGGTTEVGPQQPLNFFRMFRFSNAVSIQGSPATTEANGRMIPIIIVGIRSVPARDENATTPAGLPPFFDALGSLDALRNGGTPVNAQEDTTGNATEDGVERPLASLANGGEPSTTTLPETVSDIPFSHAMEPPASEEHVEASSRPQLHSTDSASSRISTRESRRASRPMSGIMDSVMDHLRSFRSESADSQTGPSESTRRRRRRPAWRPFSSNDGQEAEEEDADATLGATRSWIIYVLGGTYPENHPILTTPSLFTDSPTYEDMLLLSNLIGPAKPETASAADIDSAGPTYTISIDNPQIIERCQICLADYEAEDTCRRLTKCSHYFHRECIDEWLTTGRNNCPLCRTETAARTQEIAGTDPAVPESVNAPTQAEATVPEVENQA